MIPVYNEGPNIGQTLRRIVNTVRFPFRVNIVYDFDEDDSLPVASNVAQDLAIDTRFVRNKYGGGVLNAIKTGFEETDHPYVIVTMADLSDPPEVMNNMFHVAVLDGADVVCASRYMKGGSQTGGPFLKTLLSRLAGVSLFYLAGIPTHDATNSFKLYGRKVLQSITIESTGGFELGIEIVVKAHQMGFKIAEVPTHWTERVAGQSRFRLIQWLPNYLRWYWRAIAGRGGRATKRWG